MLQKPNAERGRYQQDSINRLQGFCRTLGHPESAREQSWKEPSAWIIPPSLFSPPQASNAVGTARHVHFMHGISNDANVFWKKQLVSAFEGLLEPPSSTCNPKGCHDAVAVLPVAGGMISSAMREGVDDGRDAHGQRYIRRQAGRVPA